VTNTHLSDSTILRLKLVFLPAWIEMITMLRIGQELKKVGKSFYFECAGNSLEIYYFDWDGDPAIQMPFEEFVGMNIAFFAQKNNYRIV